MSRKLFHPLRPTLIPEHGVETDTTLRSCDNPKVNPSETLTPDVQIPITFADSVGGEATSQVVDVHVLSTEDGPIEDLALSGDDLSKIDPYFGHNDEADSIRDTGKGEE